MRWLFYPIAFFLGVVFIGMALAGVAKAHPCASIFGAVLLIPMTMFIRRLFPLLGLFAVVIFAAWLFLGPHFIRDVGANCFTQTKAEWDATIRQWACKLKITRAYCLMGQVVPQAARDDNRQQLECLVDAAKPTDPDVCKNVAQCPGAPDFNGGSQWLTCASTAATGKLDPKQIVNCTNPNMLEPVMSFGEDALHAVGRIACASIYGALSWLPPQWQPTDLVAKVRRCSMEPTLASCPGL